MHVQRVGNKPRGLLERLVEEELVEAPSDLLPFLLCRVRELLRVGVTEIQESNVRPDLPRVYSQA